MTEQQRTLLADLDQASVGAAPVETLLAHIRSDKRHRSRIRVAGAAVMTGVVIGGGVLGQQVLLDGGGGASDAPGPATLQVAAGQRLVGMNGVAVAVPDSWVKAENGCALETGVVWRYPDRLDSGSVECPAPPPDGDRMSLAIGRLDSVEGRKLTGEMMAAGRPVEGEAVLEGGGLYQLPKYCDTPPDSRVQTCTLMFSVPSREVFFYISIRSQQAEAVTDAIRNSLQLLPEGYTTVPFSARGASTQEVVDTLTGSGFEVVQPSPVGQTIAETEPSGGSVVPEGSTITVLSMTSTPSQSERVDVTRCDKVILPTGGLGEADYNIDKRRGLLDINFGDTRNGAYRNITYTIEYRTDPTCASTPAMADLIARVIGDNVASTLPEMPPSPTESDEPTLLCDPGEGTPQPQPGCPDPRPTTGWLTVTETGDIVIRHFQTLHNDADGKAYARREGLEFPFANDYLDVSDGSSQTLQLTADTACSGINQVDYRSPLADHPVDCAEILDAARAHRVPVAIWRDGPSIVQVSELYRP